MNKALFISAGLIAAAVYFGSGRKPPVSAQAADARRTAFLIRFGMDGKAGVDWSGSIEPAPGRIAPYQFARGESIQGTTWKCATKEENYWDTPYERLMQPTSNRDKVTAKGIVVEFDAAKGGDVRVATAKGEFSFPLDAALWPAPRQFLDGRVEVRAAPLTTVLKPAPKASDDYPSLAEAKDGTLWLAYQSYLDGDQILVRRRAPGGAWSQPEELTPRGGDFFRTAVAEDRRGKIWVVWSAQVSGNFDLYARAFDGKSWSPEQRLTSAPGSDIFHTMTRDRNGNLYLAYQSSRNGNFDIYLRSYDGKKWSEEMQVSSDPANDWEPALAASPDGRVSVLWDSYAGGSYDVVARTLEKGKLGPLTPIASTGAFEARVSAQYDRQGRLWMAWDESDWNWGKDYGNAIPESGRGLLTRRQARVAVLANGKLMQPAASIADAIPADFRQVFHQPRIALDGAGAPWVLLRYRVNLPKQQGKAEPANRALWRAGLTRYADGRWTPLVEFPECYGRIDAPSAAVAVHDGLELAWTTDGRLWPTGALREQAVCSATLPAGGPGAAPDLVAYQPPTDSLASSHPAEKEDVARARAYRAKAGGAEFRIARGDVHRHTDISWDGNRDGSLNDSYRYALDAVAFDYLGVCDHQGGQSVPYNWWMLQKAVDLYTIAGRFTPLYSYERSLPYPNGHRNVLFTTRGKPILEISEAEQRGVEGAAKLYAYLRKLGGVTAAHTSATGAGTDFRDSDAEVEPIVEIYQGYRTSYEGPATPRQDNNESRRHEAGYVQNAWAKGIKLGVQSSSDHVSTHISYAAIYVDKLDREGLMRAIKARRTFAATDNIVVDFRVGEHFMGESFTASGAAPIKAYIHGTGPVASVTLVKNNRAVYSKPGEGSEMNFAFTDTDVKAGDAYYYVRVLQKNGQIAWSSPVWVKYE